jgi:hypothetical protein
MDRPDFADVPGPEPGQSAEPCAEQGWPLTPRRGTPRLDRLCPSRSVGRRRQVRDRRIEP